MPTTNCPALVWLPFTCLSNASAGGQLEHPADVNSSTSTVFCASALAVISARTIPAAIVLLRMHFSVEMRRTCRVEGYKNLHIGVAVAHILVEGWLGQRESLLQAGAELSLACQQRRCRGRKVFFLAQNHQPIRGQSRRGAHELLLGRVQVLRVSRVSDPYRPRVAQHTREPEDLAQQKLFPAFLIGIGEEELLLPAAVIARGYRNRLAIAALEQLQLTLVEGLADRAVDEGFRIRLLGSRNNFRKGHSHAGGDFGVEQGIGAIGYVNHTVDDVGIGARNGTVEGPTEVTESNGHAGYRHIGIRPRIAQSLGLIAQMGRHFRQKLRTIEVEVLTQLQP